MFATGVTMGLAEWIIEDTCLANLNLGFKKNSKICSGHVVRSDSSFKFIYSGFINFCN